MFYFWRNYVFKRHKNHSHRSKSQRISYISQPKTNWNGWPIKNELSKLFQNELLQFLDIVHIIEEERAKADFAHATGNYKAESLSLDIIFHALVKTDDENINYRKMIDTLYYDYINSYIRKFSDKTHKELYQKILEKNF